ncbi:MAG TPA: alpha/beta fold hydrolase [Longimicrobiales bacterium]|nr:alpha/beta fold hydrolase [Longimicrobiales bacterium]
MARDPRPASPPPVDGYRPRPFRPAWWLPGPHAQTIAGKLLRPEPELTLRRERLETPDGDFVDLDHASDPGNGAPVVLVLHGLEGSARRHYMKLTYAALLERGMHPIGMNFRSCSTPVAEAPPEVEGGARRRGGAARFEPNRTARGRAARFEPNRTARLYHSGETGDLAFVLGRLRERFPGRAFGAVGFSLGGNVLLKFLGEAGRDGRAPLDAAAAVSVPFDLSAGSTQLERGLFAWLYTRYFMRGLRSKTAAKAELLGDRCDLAAVRRARTLRQFDDAATAPLHGFRDAEDYYARSSSARFIAHIRVPTLLIHALDDPFLPAEHVPRAAVEANAHLTPLFPRAGGHVGFVGGSPAAPTFWAEGEAARYLEAHLHGGAPAGRRRGPGAATPPRPR